MANRRANGSPWQALTMRVLKRNQFAGAKGTRNFAERRRGVIKRKRPPRGAAPFGPNFRKPRGWCSLLYSMDSYEKNLSLPKLARPV